MGFINAGLSRARLFANVASWHCLATLNNCQGIVIGVRNFANMSSTEPTAAMPPMMYGTAWKKDRTADLVYEAIKAGFRGIDTAAMKKHYDEALTGEGIRRAIREGLVSRKDLFVSIHATAATCLRHVI